MITHKEWFSVDKEGLKELQSGKPKHYILRELIQNAWDEPITECNVTIEKKDEFVMITVKDDSPIGFRDLKDSYTLFGHTYKRKDPEKRGRFNIGEKQAFSICEECIVTTTKGTVIFNNEGRKHTTTKTKKGTVVGVKLKATEQECGEMINTVMNYLVPKNIKFTVNGVVISYRTSLKEFQAKLLTEWEKDNVFRRSQRLTTVHVFKPSEQGKSTLYEMGIPVTEIECDFDIDVQQKIPLSVDRETVLQSFLKDLYAEVLNQMHNEIEGDRSSQTWIRTGMTDERIQEEAVKDIITKRYGDKVCVANPFDKISVDEAISHGYNVIKGTEMSKEEWDAVKQANMIPSSSELFGHSFTDSDIITNITENQKATANYAKKIAKRLLNLDLKVQFVRSKASMMAGFGDGTLTFNLSNLPKTFFDQPISVITTDLIIHELGHFSGMHTEKKYHELLTKLAGELVILALTEPEFFEVS